jgi:trehalose-phosphatase
MLWVSRAAELVLDSAGVDGPRASDDARELAAEVAQAASAPGAARVLLLDVDGTLAPIAPTPEAARVLPDSMAAVGRLCSSGWTLALVSGRPARQVRDMVPLDGPLVFGSHGLEAPEGGADSVVRLDPALARRLDRLTSGGEALAAEVSGARVERKPAGLAFHDRLVPDDDLAGWRTMLREWLGRQELDGLETMDGRRVLELRPAGAHKGGVVRRLARERGVERFDGSFVAVGDDRTDEDMFVAIRELGLSVRVGPAGVATAAVRRLATPASVARFLTLLTAP